MSLSWKGGVESEWPREGVVTARISVDESEHGSLSEMNRTILLNKVVYKSMATARTITSF